MGDLFDFDMSPYIRLATTTGRPIKIGTEMIIRNGLRDSITQNQMTLKLYFPLISKQGGQDSSCFDR